MIWFEPFATESIWSAEYFTTLTATSIEWVHLFLINVYYIHLMCALIKKVWNMFIHRKAMVPYGQLSTNCGLDNFITVQIFFIVPKAYSKAGWQLHIRYHSFPVYKEFPVWAYKGSHSKNLVQTQLFRLLMNRFF